MVRRVGGRAHRLFRAYVEEKLAKQALDYDDLLLYWHVMMQDAALAAEIGAQFDHVLVDEYQDTNVLQAEILLRAASPTGEGVTVVGDDAQAIYSFRAATVENILGFPATILAAGASVVTLEENYRSTQAVLDAANALMAEGDAAVPQGPARTTRRRRAAALRHGRRTTRRRPTYVVERVLETRERGVAAAGARRCCSAARITATCWSSSWCAATFPT